MKNCKWLSGNPVIRNLEIRLPGYPDALVPDPRIIGYPDFLYYVRSPVIASVSTPTVPAPASLSTRAASEAVAPVVNRSSMSSMFLCRRFLSFLIVKAPFIFVQRCFSSRRLWGAVWRIRRKWFSPMGIENSLASSRASNCAWLYPRSRDRVEDKGIGTIASNCPMSRSYSLI